MFAIIKNNKKVKIYILFKFLINIFILFMSKLYFIIANIYNRGVFYESV